MLAGINMLKITKKEVSIIIASFTGLVVLTITTILIISRLSQPVSYKPKALTSQESNPQCRLTVDVIEAVIPTPLPPSCQSLTLNGRSENLVINQGSSVNIAASVNNYLIIRYGKVNQVDDRLISSANPQTLIKGNNSVNFVFTPGLSEAGVFVFEVNAYDGSSCRYFCSAGRTLYEDSQNQGATGCETAGHWNNVGSCQSGCIRWLTINPS